MTTVILIPWTGDRVDEQFLLVVFVIEASSMSFMVRIWRAWVSARVTTIPS